MTTAIWSSMRNMGQTSLRSTAVGYPDRDAAKDVEKGLHQRTSTIRRPAPPIIQVTDTDRETAPATGDSMHAKGRTSINDIDRSRTGNEGEVDSEGDLTSISFANLQENLVVPSAHRVSSDSSRSLPTLPSDASITRCMSYSPNGMFLCVGNIRCGLVSLPQWNTDISLASSQSSRKMLNF